MKLSKLSDQNVQTEEQIRGTSMTCGVLFYILFDVYSTLLLKLPFQSSPVQSSTHNNNEYLVFSLFKEWNIDRNNKSLIRAHYSRRRRTGWTQWFAQSVAEESKWHKAQRKITAWKIPSHVHWFPKAAVKKERRSRDAKRLKWSCWAFYVVFACTFQRSECEQIAGSSNEFQ